jgi:(p)ppGpp synthase/HD superfamily hydrolase
MNRKLQLINWVRTQHQGEFIKDTYTPYFEHVLAVANQVAEAAPLTYEIGLCHDLLEKTTVAQTDLLTQLIGFGYGQLEAEHISSCVAELTRHFTKAESPLPKQMRKALEDERLLSISADAQTVKYADWHYNADWMMLHDRHHAADYLKRHIELTEAMSEGDAALRDVVLTHFRSLLRQLKNG